MKQVKYNEIPIKQMGNQYSLIGMMFSNNATQETMCVVLPNENIWANNMIKVHPDTIEYRQFITQLDEQRVLLQVPTQLEVKKCERQISDKIKWGVYDRDKYTCQYCYATVKTGMIPSTDHIVLWEAMGESHPDNMLCACKTCNNKRSNTPFLEWIEQYTGVQKEKLLEQYEKAIKIPLRKVQRSKR